ncbi:MAG: outer membrane beta-barrel protein [Bacteroidota bacterium]|nr:outer membrane beta-barrel protein [Bacteroidota bacterium]
MKSICTIFLFLGVITCNAQSDSTYKIPFEGMDLTWMNGQSRITNPILAVKDKTTGQTIITGIGYMDADYNYNFADPVDNTHTISSTIGRHNEIHINLASLGVDVAYKNMIGRILLQYGAMLNIVQDLDPTVNRGRNTSIGNLKYIREGAAGYHFNKWYGINLEAGIFMSYMGLESYIVQDNWCFQRSTVCEFTPFYFQGARLQIYPTKKFKQEILMLNGWQSYNSAGKSPGIGTSTYWRPNENIQYVANFYYGHDTQNPDTLGNQSQRMRFHHDNSIVARYLNKPKSKGISQMAFSINSHYGFEKGMDAKDSVTSKEHYMYGTSICNRIWLYKNKIAFTLRGDVLSNGGQYLAFSPSPVAPSAYTDELALNPKKPLIIKQGTFTFDIMPTEFTTFRIEYGYRQANIPYFAGHGGTTSPSGWTNGPTTVVPWRPDLQKYDSRITVVMNFRF